MNGGKWLGSLAWMGIMLIAPIGVADIVPVTLQMSPSAGEVNRLDISITISGLGKDTDTATITGTMPADFYLDFDPITQEAELRGITFHKQTPGTIGVSDIDLGDLLRFHHGHGRLATLTAVRPPARFGGIVFDGDRVAEPLPAVPARGLARSRADAAKGRREDVVDEVDAIGLLVPAMRNGIEIPECGIQISADHRELAKL